MTSEEAEEDSKEVEMTSEEAEEDSREVEMESLTNAEEAVAGITSEE